MRSLYPSQRRQALLVAGLALAIAAVLAALLAVALGRGAGAGPELTLRVGSYYLVARTTEHPACLPLPEQCFIPRPAFRMPQPRYYAVWAGQISYPPFQGGGAPFARVEGQQIVQVELAP